MCSELRLVLILLVILSKWVVYLVMMMLVGVSWELCVVWMVNCILIWVFIDVSCFDIVC